MYASVYEARPQPAGAVAAGASVAQRVPSAGAGRSGAGGADRPAPTHPPTQPYAARSVQSDAGRFLAVVRCHHLASIATSLQPFTSVVSLAADRLLVVALFACLRVCECRRQLFDYFTSAVLSGKIAGLFAPPLKRENAAASAPASGAGAADSKADVKAADAKEQEKTPANAAVEFTSVGALWELLAGILSHVRKESRASFVAEFKSLPLLIPFCRPSSPHPLSCSWFPDLCCRLKSSTSVRRSPKPVALAPLLSRLLFPLHSRTWPASPLHLNNPQLLLRLRLPLLLRPRHSHLPQPAPNSRLIDSTCYLA